MASHYLRTQGDPVASLRACLRALAQQVGNRRIGLIGTTGSAREIVGAYLGTEYVFNEISAHAAGAAHFDWEVDTIMEIGGQDSKYILLRNGVPIDYAMNNACSAGTGSFLEESAKSDLGVTVSEISSVALGAKSPVHFKATCAAFINSDIRGAQQQGHSHDDIVAGLVYAIAANYLTKVKGPRCVGRKVFLQGGVALNHALGNAFAHLVGRPVVIPPHPELLGALGVALLTLKRSTASAEAGGELLSLAAPELERVGRFACHACKLYCSIDRFKVGGRVFPFGGRCSLYENVWKRKSRTAAARDLVEERTNLLFGRPAGVPANWGASIGIPKALLTHSLHPLFSTFFSGLGIETVLSGVDPHGELRSNAGFCFPVQIAHGAVLDLANEGVNLIFLPQVVHMPQPHGCGDCYLCPITQASPAFMAKAFPDLHFLSPLLDFSKGYEGSAAMGEMAVRDLGISRELAASAWTCAVRAQVEAESTLRGLGQKTLDEAVAGGKMAILLAGHSYSAYAPEASQSVAKKLSSMGVTVIPGDCLAPIAEGPTAWHFANQILNAAAIVKTHPNLFLLCVSNFSCTIDAFTQSILASEMGSKPHLILEIDAHTADAGIQTRLEAFLDIAANYRARQTSPIAPFNLCQLVPGGRVVRTDGEIVRLDDPGSKSVSRTSPISTRKVWPGRLAGWGSMWGKQFRWTEISWSEDLATPRGASACLCRSASGSSCKSPRTVRPTKSRAFTWCAEAPRAYRIVIWAISKGSSPSSDCPISFCSIREKKTTGADWTASPWSKMSPLPFKWPTSWWRSSRFCAPWDSPAASVRSALSGGDFWRQLTHWMSSTPNCLDLPIGWRPCRVSAIRQRVPKWWSQAIFSLGSVRFSWKACMNSMRPAASSSSPWTWEISCNTPLITKWRGRPALGA